MGIDEINIKIINALIDNPNTRMEEVRPSGPAPNTVKIASNWSIPQPSGEYSQRIWSGDSLQEVYSPAVFRVEA